MCGIPERSLEQKYEYLETQNIQQCLYPFVGILSAPLSRNVHTRKLRNTVVPQIFRENLNALGLP